MANRDPQTPPADHTVAIIGGAVALFALLVALALGLEATDSPNTMPLIGVLGTGIGVVVIGQIMQLNRTSEATKVAKTAAATADDTNQRAQQIQQSLNGGFDERVTKIVTAVMDAKLEAFAITRDERMRVLIAEELARRDVSCQIPQPQPARRRRS